MHSTIFEAIATEYTLILDTQRALFASGNVDGAIETLARGDAIARQAGRCGRRLAPAREALANNQYRGPRATELSRRLAAVGVRADVLGANAMQLAAACTVKRDGISTELSSAATASPAVGRGTIGYLSSVRTPMALDVTR